MLNIVTALACEAKPIRRYYDLSSDTDKRAFPIYKNENIRLIVSGVGKINAAAAVAYLHGLDEKQSSAWLNIGTVGHSNLDIGDLTLIDRITDNATQVSWYPPIVYKHNVSTNALLTVDKPETEYQGESAFDMEASGYYPTATRIATGELVQCIKVISDNSQTSAESINAGKLEGLIAGNMDEIDQIVQAINGLHGTLPINNLQEFKILTGAWRFTTTQRHQLNELLQSCRARKVSFSVETAREADCVNARDVLACIDKKLKETSITF
ncbi:MAG: hypothetical protein OER96_13845 [Gammaproteobacteria bacterium]|nr:hypothetical protein [Gammaproteobacteria bacterium]